MFLNLNVTDRKKRKKRKHKKQPTISKVFYTSINSQKPSDKPKLKFTFF